MAICFVCGKAAMGGCHICQPAKTYCSNHWDHEHRTCEEDCPKCKNPYSRFETHQIKEVFHHG